jgi:ADP-dependent phosphofructokinase/glucokinase
MIMGEKTEIMTNAFSQLRVSRVIPNVAVPSKIQFSLFSRKSISFPMLPCRERKIKGLNQKKIWTLFPAIRILSFHILFFRRRYFFPI